MKDDANVQKWGASPNAKARNAVQRSVTALLDELAPERVLSRVDRVPGRIEQHRTPNGCVLQAAQCAISVSWFPESSKEATLGELHIVVWRGKVTRRGAPSQKGATILADMMLRPMEPPTDDFVWEATDGTRYDTAKLAAHCLALLEKQIGESATD